MCEKAKNVKLLILDVDGVLTDGMLYYSNQDLDMRSFYIQDGLGIKLLQKIGVTVAVLSAKNSSSILKRMQELAIKHIHLGHEDKLPIYENIKQELNLLDKDIAYMGDDLPDLPLLKRAEFAITVPHAPVIIKENADYITKKKGGKGAVREVCELIMQTQGQYQSILNDYDK